MSIYQTFSSLLSLLPSVSQTVKDSSPSGTVPPAVSPNHQATGRVAIASSDSSDTEDSTLLCHQNPEDDIPPPAQIVYNVACAARRARDLERHIQYVNKRSRLQGRKIILRNKSKPEVTWTVTDNEDMTGVSSNNDVPESVGLTNFDFKKCEIPDSAGRSNRRINFMKLLFALWPGNIHHQLLVLNIRIEKDNAERRRGRVLPVLLREFCHFLGVLLIARLEGKCGADLWSSTTPNREGYFSQTDVSCHMTKYRHTQIRRYFSFFFAEETQKESNPWWQVIGGIKGFNHNCRTVFTASHVRCMDEMMSAFCPQTTATGNLPNISYIQCKPKPLGTELKCVACGQTGVMIYLELQQGKHGMCNAKFVDKMVFAMVLRTMDK